MKKTTEICTIDATITHAVFDLRKGNRANIICEGTRFFNFCQFGVSLDLYNPNDAKQFEIFKKFRGEICTIDDFEHFELRVIVGTNAKGKITDMLAIGYRSVDLFYVLDGDGQLVTEKKAQKIIKSTLKL